MNDQRDDEPIGIEADAPEADWIEQHQPVSDEDDAYADALQALDNDDAVSIESDTPEADWIEQHQPIVEAPDEARLPPHDLPEDEVEASELEQDWIAADDDVGAANDQEIPTRPAATEARGCNALVAVVHAVLRSGSDAAQRLERRNRQPPS